MATGVMIQGCEIIGAKHLRLLAKVVEVAYRNDPNPDYEMQLDILRWADGIEKLLEKEINNV